MGDAVRLQKGCVDVAQLRLLAAPVPEEEFAGRVGRLGGEDEASTRTREARHDAVLFMKLSELVRVHLELGQAAAPLAVGVEKEGLAVFGPHGRVEQRPVLAVAADRGQRLQVGREQRRLAALRRDEPEPRRAGEDVLVDGTEEGDMRSVRAGARQERHVDVLRERLRLAAARGQPPDVAPPGVHLRRVLRAAEI